MAVEQSWTFAILGPLIVRNGDREVDLGGTRQRALLALLLLHRGDPVSADRLAEELWGNAPPAGAAKTIQVYVSRLRSALGDGLVARRGPGYTLDLGAGQVDADHFERLVDEGRQRLTSGDARAARERLDQAVALWRGSPLAEFEYENWAQPERRRLEELHLLALEERIEAQLALGEAERLVPELNTLVAEHPLREHLRGQAMLALYRSGRQAEALALFQDGRRHLVEELGVEPGAELRELQRQMLAQAPELGPIARRRPLPDTRRGRRLLAVGALLLAGAAAAAAVELTSSGSTAVAANAIAILSPTTIGCRRSSYCPRPPPTSRSAAARSGH